MLQNMQYKNANISFFAMVFIVYAIGVFIFDSNLLGQFSLTCLFWPIIEGDEYLY